VAQDVIDEAEEALGGGLRSVMFHGPQAKLTSTENAQPGGGGRLFHSALVAAGALAFEDAVKLVRLRGTAMQQSVTHKETTMRALVVMDGCLEEIEALMEKVKRSIPEGEVAEIANINSNFQLVLSGTTKGVDYASSIIQAKGLAGKGIALPVSAPFHCKMMASAQETMAPAIANTTFKEPVIEVISNVTGRPFESAASIGEMLTQQITKTVQWNRSIRFAKDDDVDEWVVVGPSRVLANLIKKEHPLDTIRSISTQEDVENYGQFLKSL
ncbi:hypothetical protein HK102_004012, partial [Quaeritorhiza haematococci]